MLRALRDALVLSVTVAGLAGCEYAGLLRPSVLSQLDPPTARLLNELPAVDRPNEATVARLFATGGLAHAEEGADGVLRASVGVPKGQLIWRPAVVVMPRGRHSLDRHASYAVTAWLDVGDASPTSS